MRKNHKRRVLYKVTKLNIFGINFLFFPSFKLQKLTSKMLYSIATMGWNKMNGCNSKDCMLLLLDTGMKIKSDVKCLEKTHCVSYTQTKK